MTDEIEKTEQPSPDDVLAAIQSFNDPSIITNIFHELGWSYSLEIRETLIMAKQNANLSIKFKAIKHLRELLREAAESSGLVANVSQTFPNDQGGHTTFHAKRIAGILNPVKKIESTEIKEPENDKTKKGLQSIESPSGCDGMGQTRTKPNRESNRRQSQDTQEQFPSNSTGCPRPTVESERDVISGGTEPVGGGQTPRPIPGGRTPSGDAPPRVGDNSTGDNDNPCIKTRPPTCDQDLFPGISSAGD